MIVVNVILTPDLGRLVVTRRLDKKILATVTKTDPGVIVVTGDLANPDVMTRRGEEDHLPPLENPAACAVVENILLTSVLK